MLLTLTARDLVLASFEVEPGRVARSLPAGLEPALTREGAALVSAVALRAEEVSLAGRRGPSYRQLTVRTYVAGAGGEGIFFLSVRVTPGGLAGAAFGIPVRPARIRVADGSVEAPGLGVSLRYRRLGPALDVPEVGGAELGSHETAFFPSAGLRRLHGEHDPFSFEAVELLAPPRLDPLLALGFDVGAPVPMLYAASTRFRVELPPAKAESPHPGS